MPSRLREAIERSVRTLILAGFPALAGAQGLEIDSFAEASEIQQLIRDERQQGNAEAAWNLELDLVRLALRNPDDVRFGRILRDIGDRRIDILTQYDAGEFPPEIILGCYYNDPWELAGALRRGSQPVTVTTGGGSCAGGSRDSARRALLESAQWYYVESARTLLRSQETSGDEAQELVAKILASSYKISDYRIGRWSLEALRLHQEANSASWLMKARTLTLMGDWDLLFARHFGTKYRDAAIAAYEQAITLLDEHGIDEDAVDSIFSPQTPVLLPAFASNPLITQQTAGSTGHVDITFEIREDGKSRRIKVLDSSVNAPKSVQRDLVDTIRRGQFRPIAANGRLLESAPVTVRYYLND